MAVMNKNYYIKRKVKKKCNDTNDLHYVLDAKLSEILMP